MQYKAVPPADAYALQNAGGLVLVCTQGIDGDYNLAPVAWCCPFDYEPVSRFLVVLDTGHKTFKDIQDRGAFVLALPSSDQKELVKKCGTVSGFRFPKYEKYGIKSFKARKVDAKIPEGVVGWIECKVFDIIIKGTSALVVGDTLHAEAVESAWKNRLHYVGGEIYYSPGEMK